MNNNVVLKQNSGNTEIDRNLATLEERRAYQVWMREGYKLDTKGKIKQGTARAKLYFVYMWQLRHALYPDTEELPF